MTDLVERLRGECQCPENHGCGTMKVCACGTMMEAADEIERLWEGERAAFIAGYNWSRNPQIWELHTTPEREFERWKKRNK